MHIYMQIQLDYSFELQATHFHFPCQNYPEYNVNLTTLLFTVFTEVLCLLSDPHLIYTLDTHT